MEALEDRNAPSRGRPGVAGLFGIGQWALARLRRGVATGGIPECGMVKGRFTSELALDQFVDGLAASYPLPTSSPFEGTEQIAGGVWVGRELLGAVCDDGLARLVFAAETSDLPFHVHEWSERFLVVMAGSGTFRFAKRPLDSFCGEDLCSVPVRAGDAVMFTRGLIHTFTAGPSGLELLSWQSPYIPFDDPRQYTVARVTWYPGMTVNREQGLQRRFDVAH